MMYVIAQLCFLWFGEFLCVFSSLNGKYEMYWLIACMILIESSLFLSTFLVGEADLWIAN